MAINNSFRETKAIINPSDLIEKYPKKFNTVIITFQRKALPGLLEQNLIQEVEGVSFGSSFGRYPIYSVVGLSSTLFFFMPVGAAPTVAILEEITYAMSSLNIILYGSAGVLDSMITSKNIIVPTKAYRDEGTSYHYMKASDFVDVNNHHIVSKCLESLNIKYVKGYTWTTDAFYRETNEIYEERKNQGCICVEMEISAVQAFANFRRLQLYTFVYSADSLDQSGWDKRVLGNLTLDERINYFLIAKHIAKSLLEKVI